MRITRFEWAFGLKYRGHPIESEYNIITGTSTYLKQLLQKRYLVFTPTRTMIQLAYDIIKHNGAARAEDRKGFHEFGQGPWEYTLFRGKYHEETLEPKHNSIPSFAGRLSISRRLRHYRIHQTSSSMAFSFPVVSKTTLLFLYSALLVSGLYGPTIASSIPERRPRGNVRSLQHRGCRVFAQSVREAWSLQSTPSSSTSHESSETKDEAILQNIAEDKAEEKPIGLGLPPARSGYDDFDDVGDDEVLRTYA
ncbi:hypothetical protein WG66_008104 [Moniliophthora roreri]|nr:hypothetical protein WG66_008104 [Moniliophthora roreri]